MTDLAEEIREFCRVNRIRLNTDLGQHFLIDRDALDAIVEAAQISPQDRIVEIGPGLGVLTRELLKHAAHVMAIEFDEKLISPLMSFTRADPKLAVTRGNALRVPLPETPYKIVANIPYHITSPLLRHAFLESPRAPISLTLLIQREVAEKICDKRDAGMLTVLVALFGAPRIVRHVGRDSFLPPPKVESSVLHIDCFDRPLADPDTIDRIFQLTKLTFSQKRKMLRNTLGTLPEGPRIMEQAGIDPERRPQTLSIQEWMTLARSMEA